MSRKESKVTPPGQQSKKPSAPAILVKQEDAPPGLPTLTPGLLPAWVVHTPRPQRSAPAARGRPSKPPAQPTPNAPPPRSVPKPAAAPSSDVLHHHVPNVIVRNATRSDVEGIRSLLRRAYPEITPYSAEQLEGQLTNFPPGQFIAIHDGQIVGYTASFRLAERVAFAPHSFLQITGHCTASRHDPNGDWLYRMEVCADPEFPGWRDGGRLCSAGGLLVDALKSLCMKLGLKGVLSCSRMPDLGRAWPEVGSALEYVKQILARKRRDRVLAFHMRNGFEVTAVLSNYIPYDPDSKGYAARVVWRNPKWKGAPATTAETAARESAQPLKPVPASEPRPAVDPAKVIVREATLDDVHGIRRLLWAAYSDIIPYSTRQVRGQIEHFPIGQLVAIHDGRIVGYAASFRIAEAVAFAPHTFAEITAHGYASRHDPTGDWLYGMEVATDPKFPSWRVGGEVRSVAILLMEAGRAYCRKVNLKGMIGGARMPGLSKRWDEVGSAEAYVEQFKSRKLRDPVLAFHVRHGYEVRDVLSNYVPYDPSSLGYAARVVWRNPDYVRPRAKPAATPPLSKGETPTLPGAMRSFIDDVAWPALPAPRSQRQIAIQFQLEQTQWWSPERIREQQFAQIAQLVRHAGTTVPYYRELFKRIGLDPNAPLRPEDWKKLPILTRRDLQESSGALKSEAIPPSHGGTFTCTSSGSTATPVTVVKTHLQQQFWQANTLRDHLWHKRDFSARLASIRAWENVNDHPYPNGSKGERWGASSRAFATGPGYMLGFSARVHEQAEWLQRVQPQYLMSYPSNLEALAHYCLDKRISFPWLVQLRSMSEVLRPEVRDICRTAWSVEIKDTYSAEEVGLIALQSPVREELLVMAETLFVEVLDGNGRDCAPGETGRLVVTPLHAFAMPLIRLAQGDLAVVGGRAACGRGLPVLKEVLGRERNMVKLPNGHMHYPSYAYMMKGFDKLIQFQIVRKAVEVLELRLVVRAELDEAEKALMIERVRERFQYPFQISFAYVDEIPRTPRGKFIDYISEID